jgi:hypothetical protein
MDCLFDSFGCGNTSWEGEAVACSYTYCQAHRDVPWKGEELGSTSCNRWKLFASNVNNSCLEWSWTLPMTNAGELGKARQLPPSFPTSPFINDFHFASIPGEFGDTSQCLLCEKLQASNRITYPKPTSLPCMFDWNHALACNVLA